MASAGPSSEEDSMEHMELETRGIEMDSSNPSYKRQGMDCNQAEMDWDGQCPLDTWIKMDCNVFVLAMKARENWPCLVDVLDEWSGLICQRLFQQLHKMSPVCPHLLNKGQSKLPYQVWENTTNLDQQKYLPRHVHMGEAKHSRVKSIPCPHCQKMFSRKGHMTEHVRTVHEGKKRIYKEVKSNATSLFSELNITLVGELSTLWQNLPA